MQLEIRTITTTVRPLEPGGEEPGGRVDLEQLARLVAMELARSTAATAGRSLLSDDPAGELR